MNYKTLKDVLRVTEKGKSQEVIDVFTASYLQGIEHESWLLAQRKAHAVSYPKTLDGDAVLDEEDNILYYDQIENPEFISFKAWMKETEEVETGTKDVLDELGEVTGTESIYKSQLIRGYADVDVDVETWQTTQPDFLKAESVGRVKLIAKLTVKTSAGNMFVADDKAQLRMLAAIQASDTLNVTESEWRLADNSLVIITIDELKEAQALSVQAMGEIILKSKPAKP